MWELDKRVVAAANNAQQLSALIEQHEQFILRSAAKTAKRYVLKSDDEWSIALNAFYEAIQKYDYDMGSFIAFAELFVFGRKTNSYLLDSN